MCFGDEVPEHPTHLGFVDPNCYVEETVKGNKRKKWTEWKWNLIFFINILDAFANAQDLCENYYLTAPPLKIRTLNGMNFSDFLLLIVLICQFN